MLGIWTTNLQIKVAYISLYKTRFFSNTLILQTNGFNREQHGFSSF